MKKHICIALSLAVLLLTSCHSTPPVQLPANSNPEMTDVTTTVEETTNAPETEIPTTALKKTTTEIATVTMPTTTLKKTTILSKRQTTVTEVKITSRKPSTTKMITTTSANKSQPTVITGTPYRQTKSITPVKIDHQYKVSGNNFEAKRFETEDNQWIYDLVSQYFPEQSFEGMWGITVDPWSFSNERDPETGESVFFVTAYKIFLNWYINDIETDYRYTLSFFKENQKDYAGDAYVCESIGAYRPEYNSATMKTPHKLTKKEEKVLLESEWERVAEEVEHWKSEPTEQEIKYEYSITRDHISIMIKTKYGQIKDGKIKEMGVKSNSFTVE